MQENRTTGDLRAMLFGEIADLRSGKSTPGRGRAIAALGNAIVGSISAEVEAVRHLGKQEAIGSLLIARVDDESNDLG